uniref:CX domain-containing protein n=1 Tax=Panagrellus redivivus TaxID=6233 RepID=A0A7E4VCH1_PANRE
MMTVPRNEESFVHIGSNPFVDCPAPPMYFYRTLGDYIPPPDYEDVEPCVVPPSSSVTSQTEKCIMVYGCIGIILLLCIVCFYVIVKVTKFAQ